MRYKVIEYWPNFVERNDEPREAIVNSLDEVKSISWVRKEWKVRGDHLVNEDKMVVANIYPCE